MVYSNGKKILQLSGCEAVYTSCAFQMTYITGMGPENGCVIVDKDGVTLYTDMRYMEATEKLFAGTDIKPAMVNKTEIMNRLAGYNSVGISFDQTTYTEYLALEKAGVQMQNVDEAYTQAMITKNDWELDNIAKACEIAEDAFNELLPEIREGMTETEVAALLEYKMRKLGAQGLSFDTIVAFGAHAAVPHHETGLTKLSFGDPILIDFGCKVNGYCSDITRTFLFGDDGKHEEFKKAYASVLKAHNLVKEKVTAGMTGKEADAIARDSLKADGYGNLFTHSLGHGIGLNVHEKPSVSPKGEQVLENGMVFSDEPGVYAAGEYGIRIEDTVTLKNGKVVSFMSKTDRNLIIL
ncbi:MAG: aminopeptidase P family protein [Clostridiales bacterium]|nr:aminopeptidase P family protein [Clostridiales bacterium]